jgi:hypothetical protein
VLAAAAVCPHPPLLVPEIAAGAAAEAEPLRRACLAAVRAVLDASADELVVVGTGPNPGSARPGAWGTFAGFGVPVTVALCPDGQSPDGDPELPLSISVGVWLLRRAGYTGRIRARALTERATPAEATALGERLAAYPVRTALLVMGDGSARRGEQSPGYTDPRGIAFDDAVAEALRAGDPGALRGLDPELARDLWAAGRAPWQVLAGAAGTGPVKADLLYYEAPYGVGYFAATWLPEQVTGLPEQVTGLPERVTGLPERVIGLPE